MRSLPQPRHLTGIDIAPPIYATQSLYERSIVGDITDETVLSDHFDLIWCISSLEHFGLDNSGYTDDFAVDQSLDGKAVQRMLSLLAPGGSLLITVPYGRAENHGWMRIYDRARWQSLLALAKPRAEVREWYFRHTPRVGWKLVAARELANTGYYDQSNSGAGGMAAALLTRNR